MPSVDTVTPEVRSMMMRRVRGRDTQPELTVRRLLHARGYRFRLQRRDLPGRPDLVLPRYRTAIFVHGCFWHGHPGCKRAALPATRTDFWRAKIEGNVARDARAIAELADLGYRSVVIWQCELRDVQAIVDRVDQATGRDTPDA